MVSDSCPESVPAAAWGSAASRSACGSPVGASRWNRSRAKERRCRFGYRRSLRSDRSTSSACLEHEPPRRVCRPYPVRLPQVRFRRRPMATDGVSLTKCCDGRLRPPHSRAVDSDGLGAFPPGRGGSGSCPSAGTTRTCPVWRSAPAGTMRRRLRSPSSDKEQWHESSGQGSTIGSSDSGCAARRSDHVRRQGSGHHVSAD